MAIEDKLRQGQRIRLESLALALAYSPPETPPGEIVTKAETFERYVGRDGVDNE